MAIDPNMFDPFNRASTLDEAAKAKRSFEQDVDEDGWVIDGTGLSKVIPKYPNERLDLKCGECGAPLRLRQSAKYGPFYGCSTYPKCQGTHGAHPDGSPLGTPTNKKTQAARIRAHDAFDRLWKKGPISREAAYGWLQRTMGMSAADAHIAKFDIAQCQKVVDLAKKHYDDLKHPSIWQRLMRDD